MQEFLTSKEFSTYRKKQIKEIAEHISGMLRNPDNETALQMKGALDMARKLIRLPEKLTEAKKVKELIQKQITEDFKDFHLSFVKDYMDG